MEVTGPVQVAGVPGLSLIGAQRGRLGTEPHLRPWTPPTRISAKRRWRHRPGGVATGTHGAGQPRLPLAHALGRALREGHLLVYSSDRSEQADFSSLGITGEVNKKPPEIT